MITWTSHYTRQSGALPVEPQARRILLVPGTGLEPVHACKLTRLAPTREPRLKAGFASLVIQKTSALPLGYPGTELIYFFKELVEN